MLKICFVIQDPNCHSECYSRNSKWHFTTLYWSKYNLYKQWNRRWIMEQYKYSSGNSQCRYRTCNSPYSRNNRYYLYSKRGRSEDRRVVKEFKCRSEWYN